MGQDINGLPARYLMYADITDTVYIHTILLDKTLERISFEHLVDLTEEARTDLPKLGAWQKQVYAVHVCLVQDRNYK